MASATTSESSGSSISASVPASGQNLTDCDYARYHYGGTILPDDDLLDRLAPDRLSSIFDEINAFNRKHLHPQQWQFKWHVKPLKQSMDRRKVLKSGITDEEKQMYELACAQAHVLTKNNKKYGGSFDLTDCPQDCSFKSECFQRHRSCFRNLLVVTGMCNFCTITLYASFAGKNY